MNMVYFSPVPWASFAQRPHKFVEWFHETTGGEVLWVEPYPTRFPMLDDLKISRSQPLAVSIPSWLKLVSVKTLPIEPLPFSDKINRFFWEKSLNVMGGFIKNRGNVIIAIGKPCLLASIALKRFKLFSFYDAMDYFPAFYRGWSRIAMKRREADLLKRVDCVAVSSIGLQKIWKTVRPDSILVPNGLDEKLLPAFRQRSGSNIIGYVGTIGRWFDWQWLVALARLKPDSTVRLIGSLHVPLPESLPGNIELLPVLPHAQALEAMQEFDIGLIPFQKNALTDHVDPIKYYEYRAFGLPVISTDFGEMALRESEAGVFISKSRDDIGSLLKQALEFTDNSEAVQVFAKTHSWKARFDRLKPFLLDRL